MKVNFSVIIPVYNGADTLPRALQSVLEQTYSPFEIIVVDDGSTDETAEVVRRFGDQIRYFRQENKGVSAARNAGAKAASGDWLAFLDADDWYYPDRLRWHALWIEEDSSLDFLTGDQEYRRPDGTLIRKSMESTGVGRAALMRADKQARTLMTEAEVGDFIENHFGDTPTLSVPRRTFLELGGYPVGCTVCEDVNFLIRLCARSHRIGVICQSLAVYCVHQNSATRSDPLGAQKQTVAALLPLRQTLAHAAPAVRNGLERGVRRARRDLATVLLRQGRYIEAICAVGVSFLEKPHWNTLREVLSVARGLKGGGRSG
ncbi:glycosyltransferase family A protein [Nitrosococcus wardiae]|uniref:Glycosyltransferase family 2 protein n=1 Tax=Nitrosococcus wardiae TaxID=1814290 RepID=A0A4P7BZ62_9GAMM|nr:glycosyltransferase family A protein [Nitrosococcus wardiae]QBQ54484.1 glycosyltransferase family 2 protein [Nitrosococcus wardiae]